MKETFLLKTGMAGLGAVLAHYINSVSALFWLLVLFEAADLITGLVSAGMTTGVSANEALKGFIKKLCYFVLVGVGYGVDLFINEAKDMVGMDFNYPTIFGILTVCYLLATEGISILENLAEVGVEVPFLSRALMAFRQHVSEKGEKNNEH